MLDTQFANMNLNVKTHPNCAKHSLCVCAKTDKIWFAQQCGTCSQFHAKGQACSKNMFVACARGAQCMHSAPICTYQPYKKNVSVSFAVKKKQVCILRQAAEVKLL